MNNISEDGFDLLSKLLVLDPEKRLTADEALNHQFFKNIQLDFSYSMFIIDDKSSKIAEILSKK